MTKKETIQILEIIQTSYPRFYQNTPSSELQKAIDLWADIFANDQTEVVAMAVKTLIQHLEYPPTIADVRKEIDKLVATATHEPTAMDEWNAIRQAIKSSGYYSAEMFESLPTIAKKFVGSPTQLKDWALQEDFNDSVIRGQFLKQYEILKDREKYTLTLSPQASELIQRLADKLDLKRLEGENDKSN